ALKWTRPELPIKVRGGKLRRPLIYDDLKKTVEYVKTVKVIGYDGASLVPIEQRGDNSNNAIDQMGGIKTKSTENARLRTHQIEPPDLRADRSGAKYPGHTKKLYRTGLKCNSEREVVIEFCYDQYVICSNSRSTVRTESTEKYGVRFSPRTSEQVKE